MQQPPGLCPSLVYHKWASDRPTPPPVAARGKKRAGHTPRQTARAAIESGDEVCYISTHAAGVMDPHEGDQTQELVVGYESKQGGRRTSRSHHVDREARYQRKGKAKAKGKGRATRKLTPLHIPGLTAFLSNLGTCYLHPERPEYHTGCSDKSPLSCACFLLSSPLFPRYFLFPAITVSQTTVI